MMNDMEIKEQESFLGESIVEKLSNRRRNRGKRIRDEAKVPVFILQHRYIT
jgi:hypothetical protein